MLRLHRELHLNLNNFTGSSFRHAQVPYASCDENEHVHLDVSICKGKKVLN